MAVSAPAKPYSTESVKPAVLQIIINPIQDCNR
jgi:hypothetical protein